MSVEGDDELLISELSSVVNHGPRLAGRFQQGKSAYACAGSKKQ
jgi:hypothetical protein